MKKLFTVDVVLSNGLRYMATLFLIFVALVSLGCASGMSKEECQNADWELIGYGDGSKGYSSSMIDKHRKDCAGVSSPVLSNYLHGYDRGLITYCTEINGYNSGKHGSGLNSACKDQAAELFRTGYQFGHRLFIASTEVNRLIKHLTDSKQQQVDIEQRVLELEADILRPSLTGSQRAEILLRIKRKREKLSELDEKIVHQERKLRKSLSRLNALNQDNPYEQLPPRSMPDIQVSATVVKRKPDHHDHERYNDSR